MLHIDRAAVLLVISYTLKISQLKHLPRLVSLAGAGAAAGGGVRPPGRVAQAHRRRGAAGHAAVPRARRQPVGRGVHPPERQRIRCVTFSGSNTVSASETCQLN